MFRSVQVRDVCVDQRLSEFGPLFVGDVVQLTLKNGVEVEVNVKVEVEGERERGRDKVKIITVRVSEREREREQQNVPH